MTHRRRGTLKTDDICVSEVVLMKLQAALDAPPLLFSRFARYLLGSLCGEKVSTGWKQHILELAYYQDTNLRARRSHFPKDTFPIQVAQEGCYHWLGHDITSFITEC